MAEPRYHCRVDSLGSSTLSGMGRTTKAVLRFGALWSLAFVLGCDSRTDELDTGQISNGVERPWILLVTLDTTRADRLGVESGSEATPHLDALARRGVYFSAAYSTVPTTLPSHVSMMTGVYPATHGVRENARHLREGQVLLAERLGELGYGRAAFVSGYPLAEQFGLGRGFERYDDEFGAEAVERRGAATVDAALAYLEEVGSGPQFAWVHFYDPHEPYDPPEPFRSRFSGDPYLGEIASMDREVGRLIEGFESLVGPGGGKILVIADHGEGLGDHGEALHGNLLYQETMRVPLIVAGAGIEAGRVAGSVSSRRVFDTVLSWAGEESGRSLLSEVAEPVLGEAMKPFLQYGWQPQVMAVEGAIKVIRSGALEVYDLSADPGETTNVEGAVEWSRELREALRSYPFVPESVEPAQAAQVSQEDRERLASLGYVGWEGSSALREGAPSPREMTHLFADLDRGSGLFVRGHYAEAIETFRTVLERDPNNLMVALRLAVAHSVQGQDERATRYFERARKIDPSSLDVRHYQALHYCRRGRWQEAEPLLVSVVAQMAKKLPALECLVRVRQEQERLDEAATLLERVIALQAAPGPSLAELGMLRMALQDTQGAIPAFEQASSLLGANFAHSLELGVCYMADRRFEEARAALDAVSKNHPGGPMALFKRAQVSVLLREADSAERVRSAYRVADPRLRALIESESLFQGLAWRQ